MAAFRSSARRRNSRGLRFETLESRLALTGMTDMVDAGSLAEYLAQPPEPGPVQEMAPADSPAIATATVADATLDSLVDQAVIDAPLPAVDPLAGEGEGLLNPPLPPLPDPNAAYLLSFSAVRIDGNLVLLSGLITALNPAGTVIEFGGLFEGESTTCNALGQFSLTVADPGISGMVTAHIVNSPSYMTVYLI